MATKTFTIFIETSADLTVQDIWPDGDAPEDPQPEDVMDKLKAAGYGSFWRGALEWNLDSDERVSISEDGPLGRHCHT
jgi:hypothetical protein